MRKGRLLFIFIIVLLGPYFGLKGLLRNGTVSNKIISFLLTKAKLEKEIKVELDSIDISLLFFETNFNIKTLEDSKGNNLRGSSLRINFGLKELFNRKLEARFVQLEGGEVFLSSKQDDDNDDGGEESFPGVREILSRVRGVPVKNIFIKNLNISLGDKSSLKIKKASLLNINNYLRPTRETNFIFLESLVFEDKNLDSLKLNFQLKNNEIEFSGSLLNGMSKFTFGKGRLSEKYDSLTSNFQTRGVLKDFSNFIPAPFFVGNGLVFNGQGNISFTKKDGVSFLADGEIKSPKQNYLDIKKASFSFGYDASGFVVKQFDAKNFNGGRLSLEKPWRLLFGKESTTFNDDLNGHFLLNKFSFRSTDSLLKNIIGANISSVTTGNLVVGSTNLSDRHILLEKFKFDKFNVGNEGEILSVSNLLVVGKINLPKNKPGSLNVSAETSKTSLVVTGSFGNGVVELDAKNATVDLSDFGKFSVVSVNGVTKGDLKYVRNHKKNEDFISYTFNALDLGVFNYYVGDGEGKLLVDLYNKKISVKDLSSVVGGANIFLDGSFDLFSRGEYRLDARSKNVSSSAVKQVLYASLPSVHDIVSKIEFRGHTTVGIKGNYEGTTNVDVKLRGDLIRYFGESFDFYECNLSVTEKNISLKPLVLKKVNSSIYSNISYSFDKKNLDIDISGENIRPQRIDFLKNNFGILDGSVDFKVRHEGVLNRGKGNVEISVDKLRTNLKEFEKSKISLTLNKSIMSAKMNLLDDQIIFSSWIDLKSSKKSSADLLVNIKDLKEVLSIYHPSMIKEEGMLSEVVFRLNTDFFLNNLLRSTINLSVEDFYIQRKKANLFIQYPYNEIHIQNGLVEKGSLKFSGGDYFLNLYLKGRYLKKAKSFLEGKISSDLIELIFPDKFGISIDGDLNIFGMSHYNHTLFTNYGVSAEGNKVTIGSEGVYLNDINFQITGDGPNLLIEKLEANYEGGTIATSGALDFNRLPPSLDLEFELDNIKLELLKASSVLGGIRGSLYGDNIPYSLVGSVKLKEVNIFDSINSLVSSFSTSSKSENEELLVRPSIVIETDKPIHIKNNLLDVFINTNMTVSGNNISPRVEGDFDLVPSLSKVFIKGNAFLVSDGKIKLRKNNSDIDPFFDIDAETTIDGYNLKSSIVGDIRNLKINFISNPPLPQEDIFSLLAIGVTLQKTRDLGASGINNVTSLSLGSFLLDQSGINNSLDETLGVKVSISPEILTDENSLLEGRVNSSVGQIQTRVRSATKIRLSKRISNSLNMSYSSTLGGSLDQRQEMNLNLKVDKNILIQGVYQTQSSENSENTDTTNSLGLDLIWKKTFK